MAYAHVKILFQTRKNVSRKQSFRAPSVEREYLEAIRRRSRCFAYMLRVILHGGLVGFPADTRPSDLDENLDMIRIY